jgi:rhodanese-related sulfurtransferase
MITTNNASFRYDIHINDKESQKCKKEDIHLRRFKSLDVDEGRITVSSSAQPSKEGLEYLNQKLSDKTKVVVIDCRQESHFFMGGIPISYSNKDHMLNAGKQGSEIIGIEKSLIENVKKEPKISIQTKSDREDEDDQPVNSQEVIVSEENTINLEEDLIKQCFKNGSYLRLPVESGVVVISKETIDQLVKEVLDIVKNDKSVHIHLHCSCGRKRSWQALAHVAFILFSKTMSADEIFNKLGAIGNINDIKQPAESKKSRPRPSEEYWKSFHSYCSSENGIEKTSWSEFSKNQSEKSEVIFS